MIRQAVLTLTLPSLFRLARRVLDSLGADFTLDRHRSPRVLQQVVLQQVRQQVLR